MRVGAGWLLTAVASLVLAASGAVAQDTAPPAPAPTPSPSPSASPDPAASATDYVPSHTIYKGDGAMVRLLNRAQFRWTNEMPDDHLRLPGTDAPGDSKGNFRVRRAKTEFMGWIYNPDLTYDLQLSWAGPEPGASSQSPLEDFVFSWAARHDETFHVTIGQFKVPLGRQEMTSSGRMQFCDRDILSFEFTRGRDLGVQLDGRLAKKLLYYAGIFNGNAASHIANDNAKYQYNGRVVFEPWGATGYSEGDFESRDHPLLALGVQVEHNDQRGTTQTLTEFLTVIFGMDASFKYKGFSLFGELFLRDRKPETGDSFNSNGWHAQAGYFIVRDRLEIAGRYAQWDPSDAVPGNDQKEVGGAASYYIRKHALKIQGDYRELKDDQRQTKDKEIRVQTQVMF